MISGDFKMIVITLFDTSWYSKLQRYVATSTAESEYYNISVTKVIISPGCCSQINNKQITQTKNIK